MSKLLTEFIGTFFLVFTIGLSVLSGTAVAPIPIGAMLMAMVYMGGHISGAKYNPAVSLAVMMRGLSTTAEMIREWVAQILGAIVAAVMVFVVTGKTFAPAPGAGVSPISALLVEILFTFALAIVVLNVATAKQTEGKGFYGLAIGFTVLAGAFAGGGISGGAFNPAVGIGPNLVNALFGGGSILPIWIYIVGPLVGAALAAVVFKLQHES
jgi:aquaporin Z